MNKTNIGTPKSFRFHQVVCSWRWEWDRSGEEQDSTDTWRNTNAHPVGNQTASQFAGQWGMVLGIRWVHKYRNCIGEGHRVFFILMRAIARSINGKELLSLIYSSLNLKNKFHFLYKCVQEKRLRQTAGVWVNGTISVVITKGTSSWVLPQSSVSWTWRRLTLRTTSVNKVRLSYMLINVWFLDSVFVKEPNTYLSKLWFWWSPSVSEVRGRCCNSALNAE